jgi:hypothetical protein
MNPNDEILEEQTEAEEILPEEAEKISGGGGAYGTADFDNN